LTILLQQPQMKVQLFVFDYVEEALADAVSRLVSLLAPEGRLVSEVRSRAMLSLTMACAFHETFCCRRYSRKRVYSRTLPSLCLALL
jgi:hypothetical protein